MSTLAEIGYHYTLSYCATQGGSYTPIAEVTDLKPGKTSVEKVVVQSNTSATLYGDKISGWLDVGDWDSTFVYTAAQRAAIVAIVSLPYYFKFTRPDGTTTTAWYGFVCELGDSVPLKSFMSCDAKICVSGGLS